MAERKKTQIERLAGILFQENCSQGEFDVEWTARQELPDLCTAFQQLGCRATVVDPGDRVHVECPQAERGR